MNLKKYYLENINENDYYYKFKEKIENFELDYDVYNETIAISEYKQLIQPKSNYLDNMDTEFILLSYYLDSRGYTIEQFPNQLKYPNSLFEFAYEKIRNLIGGDRVAWADRRKLIDNLSFVKKDTIIEDNNLEEIIKKIATSDIEFKNMPLDQKLENLANAIEYLLKNNDKYIKVPSDCFLGLLDNEKIIEYRKKLQCFRHAASVTVEERNLYSDQQKQFLVNIGMVIVLEINNYIKENNF